ncbi:MAG: response regulator, partial [Acidobacteriia bacterium]|nr:response regulator [Terriglobia bacterium]
MHNAIRVLIVEDSETDAKLVCRALERAAFAIHSHRVEDAAEMRTALTQTGWDIIICDYRLPQFDAPSALQIVRELRLDIPFIVVSATIGEDIAVGMMKAGAHDYLLKDNLVRLAPAVEREIKEAENRRKKREAEAAVRAAEERLRLAVQAADLGTWELDPHTRELRCDELCSRILGLPTGECISIEAFVTRVHQEDRGRMKAAWEQARTLTTSREFAWEYRVQWEDDTVRVVATHAKSFPISGSGLGEYTMRVVGTIRDVTELRRTEESLRETQKLESLGVLAGGIAHDFNNLLTGVVGNASLLADELPPDGAAAEILQSLTSAAERMSRLTSQMLAYSGRGRFTIEPIDLSKQVGQITSLIYASVPKNVELRLSLGKDLPFIDADSSQLQQVIMNLVINAAEAVGAAGGVVQVTTGMGRVGDPENRANMTRQVQPAGEYVVLTVEDNGCGIDQQTKARIFDPFFTTKFTGRGLGLSAVLGIVRSHRGLLTLDTEAGVGTTFRVYFPQSATQRSETIVPSTKVIKGHGTVLLVEDEEIVRSMAKAALTRLGYDVVIAKEGREAVEIYSKMRDKIDVVLLDMMMPVMNGQETLSRLVEMAPDLVVVATSGYDEGEAHARFGRRIAAFVQKP